MRSTDHARLLLRRAQLALAGLAVPIALAVGMIAADPSTAAQMPAVPRIVLDAGSPWMSGRPAEQHTVSGLARAEAVAVEVAATTEHQDTGRFVGLFTLFLCWALLLVAGEIWRYRLAVRDYRDWSDGWARVEPRWSDRPV